jgi:hypothetical protein
MKENELDENTMILKFICDADGSLAVQAGYHFSDEMPDDVRGGFSVLLRGIMAIMEVEPEALLKAAQYAEYGADLDRQEREQEEATWPKLSVVDFKGRVQ